MRPPICDVCGADCGEGGALVHFALRDSDAAWHVRAEASGMVGHPPEAAWLCGDHVARGQELQQLTIDVALAELASLARSASTLPEVRQVPIEPIAPGELQRLFRSRLTGLAVELGIVADVVHTSKRDWTPMDRMVEPNCPYVDLDVYSLGGAEDSVELHWERAMWSDDDISRTSAMIVGTVSGVHFRVGGHSWAGDDVVELLITGEPPDAVERLVEELGRESSAD